MAKSKTSDSKKTNATRKVSIGNNNDRKIVHKKTSIATYDAFVKTSSMNKHKRRSYKKYRGQGR